jgi:hypothetical protein
MIWDNMGARMLQDATVASPDGIIAITMWVVWGEEHLWVVRVLRWDPRVPVVQQWYHSFRIVLVYKS